MTEFVLVFEDLTNIKHLKNNVFSPLMVNLICTEKSFFKWTHHFLPYGFALNVTQMNSNNSEYVTEKKGDKETKTGSA